MSKTNTKLCLPSRKEWTAGNTDTLVEAILEVGGQAFVFEEGMDLWKQVNEQLPDWTPEELKVQFQTKVYPNLVDIVGVTEAAKFQSTKKRTETKKKSEETLKKPKIKYSPVEGFRIIRLLKAHKGKIYDSGNEFWKTIEPQFYGKRTWQSLRSHYLKQLKPNLSKFISDEKELEVFKRKFINQSDEGNVEYESENEDEQLDETENEKIHISSDDETKYQNQSLTSQTTSRKRGHDTNKNEAGAPKSANKSSCMSEPTCQKNVKKPRTVEDDNESEEGSPASMVSPLTKIRKLDSQEPTHGTLKEFEDDPQSPVIKNMPNHSKRTANRQKIKNETESARSTILFLINAMRSSNQDVEQTARTALLCLNQATKHIALLQKENK